MTAPACPPLEEMLRRTASRARRRRLVVGALAAFAAGTFVVSAMEALRAAGVLSGDRVGHGAIFLTGAAVAAVVIAVSGVLALRAGDEVRITREVDARLSLADLLPTALALVRGRVESPLATVVVAQAASALDASESYVDRNVERAPAARRWALFAALLAALVWLPLLLWLLWDWLRWPVFPWALREGPADVGISPRPKDDARRPGSGAREGGEKEKPAEPEPKPPADGPQSAKPPAKAEPDPEAPAEPDVAVSLRTSRESFEDREPVLVVVTAKPSRPQPSERGLSLSLDLDGREAPTGVRLELGPRAPRGAGEIQDLRRIPSLADRLGPGEHEVRARLRDEKTGETFESEAVRFRVESNEKDEGGGGSGGAPPPTPQPQPETPPTGAQQPPPPDPQAAPDAPPPSGEAPPDVPVKFDPQVVVPLFGEGDEVDKRGVGVVLVPGGGADAAAPRTAPLADALPDAVRRAETDVARGAVRPEDRELVRRYFDELRRLLR